MKTAFAKEIHHINVKTAFAKDLNIKIGKNKDISLSRYENVAIERCAKLNAVYKGFVLPFTIDESKINAIHRVRMLVNVGGADRIIPYGTLLTAKKNLYGNKANFFEYESRVNEKCHKNGWIFKGFVMPLPDFPCHVKVMVDVGNGNIKTPYYNIFITDKFTGKDRCDCNKGKYKESEAEFIDSATKYFDSIGWDFIGINDGYKGHKTKVNIKCRCHGLVYTANKMVCMGNGGLNCPILTKTIWAIQNGEHQVLRSDDAERPMILYVLRVGDEFLKFGITADKDTNRRIRDLQRRTKEKITLDWCHVFTPGWQAGDLEIGIKKNINGKRISRKRLPHGWSETLPISKMKDVKSFINEYINENPSEPKYFDSEINIDVTNLLSDEDALALFEQYQTHIKSMPLADVEPEDLELDLSPLEAL
ncbi:hypothetical protein GM879_00650 [Escherichia coli]|nr:hypothetical protein [Escherichia coli]